MYLGIDFGTTRTVVAAAETGRYPVAAFETAQGYQDYIPGLATWSSGALQFGWEAAATLNQAPVAALRSIKRVAGGLAPDDAVGGIAPSTITALELLTEYLKFVRCMVLERSNLDLEPSEPLQAMVAVPANASTRQRYLTLEAFRRAGFQVLGMLNEPSAAAIEYGHRNLGPIGRRSPKRYVVVYDLGGGTFDTSVVSLVDRKFELITTEGIGRLGGDDFDAVILELALAAARIPAEAVSALGRIRLLELCRAAKEAVVATSRRMLIDLGAVLPGVEPITLDLADVYAATRPLIERTLELLQRVFAVLRDYGIDPENARELGAIYLVGGGTAFPPVARLLREIYKRNKVLLAPEPHAATAVGLAIAADPEAQVLVREALTRHFGVWREGDAGRDKVFDPILAKGSGKVVTVERKYHPVHSVGHLRFLECSALTPDGQPDGDITPWGDVLFPYDPSLAGRDDLGSIRAERRVDLSAEQIVECYRYDPEGLVSVTIENRTHGYARDFILGNPGEELARQTV